MVLEVEHVTLRAFLVGPSAEKHYVSKKRTHLPYGGESELTVGAFPSLGPFSTVSCPSTLAQLTEDFESIEMGDICKRSPSLFNRLSQTGPLLDADLNRCRPGAHADAAVLKGVLLRLLSVNEDDGGYDQALSAVSWSLHDVTVQYLASAGMSATRFVQPLVFSLMGEYLQRMAPFYGRDQAQVLLNEAHRAFGGIIVRNRELEPLFVSFVAQWFLCLFGTAGHTTADHAALLWTNFWRHSAGTGSAPGFLRRALCRALHAPIECNLDMWTGGNSMRLWTAASVVEKCGGNLAAVDTYLSCLKDAVRDESFLRALVE